MIKKTTATFQQILNQTQDRNLQSLIIKARTANRLAKTASSFKTKQTAYKVKINALSGLKRNFPQQVLIENDWKHGSNIVLVAIASKNFGLHAPAHAL